MAKKANFQKTVTWDDIEFYRNAISLAPDDQDNTPGLAIWQKQTVPGYWYCTCAKASQNTRCKHIKWLSAFVDQLPNLEKIKYFDDPLRVSKWYELARVMSGILRIQPENIRIKKLDDSQGIIIQVMNEKQISLFNYYWDIHHTPANNDPELFRQRLLVSEDGPIINTRGDILDRLMKITLTETERSMQYQGSRTRKQVIEESVWFRLAYHGFRTLGNDCPFFGRLDCENGYFSLELKSKAFAASFQIFVPHSNVITVIRQLAPRLQNTKDFTFHSEPCESVVHLSMDDNQNMRLRIVLKYEPKEGETEYIPRSDLEKAKYGDYLYLATHKTFVQIKQPDTWVNAFKGALEVTVPKDRLCDALEKYSSSLFSPPNIVDEALRNIHIYTDFDRLEISPEKADKRSWYWISMQYGFGSDYIFLADILRAKKEKRRFIPVKDGWVDTSKFDMSSLSLIPGLAESAQTDNQSSQARVHRLDIYRLAAISGGKLSVVGNQAVAEEVRALMELKPSSELPELKGLVSTLRSYQKIGAQWLTFLLENKFGGLLCDDMGLGKTHQVMALMVWLVEHNKGTARIIVVSPTTVLSHWEAKIRQFAPGLKALIYHGSPRDIEAFKSPFNVLITSYGILRQDYDLLSRIHFEIAVFDEAQYIKNRDTQAHQAAEKITAGLKLCVTGTPIENELKELHALMNLVLPGYLGTSDYFENRYALPIQMEHSKKRRQELIHLIAPFSLRRLKKTVLAELPPKIEDIRTCELSDDQVRLYRDALNQKGLRLIQMIRRDEKTIPYMHVFALLNLLKQICDHPAIIEGDLNNANEYKSGKWDLFQELIFESLASGQKIVVYSQYLKMINLISRFLIDIQVDHVTLTGQSRNRGQIIQRFNDSSDCRVFVGSLKAGGTGIDLVSASVVIHYDRWWNAAGEDQATDRVHRIGQTRGVQVFKLVTIGTLEEKIHAIIEKKRNLMDSVVKEDDPGLLKAFSAEQIIDLLSLPG